MLLEAAHGEIPKSQSRTVLETVQIELLVKPHIKLLVVPKDS